MLLDSLRRKIEFQRFPDGSINLDNLSHCQNIYLKWESDEDLIHLMLYKKIHNPTILHILYMPYARMDRNKCGGSSCSLHYIAEFIKNLNFKNIFVIDPHSDLTLAYLGDNANSLYPFENLPNYYRKVPDDFYRKLNYDAIMFPDAGAQKRYGKMEIFSTKPQLVGFKERDFETGKIVKYDVLTNLELKNKNVLIVDDICSYGGTFLMAAQELKKLGASRVDLMVSHCENSIEKGELLKENSPITEIYTTDTLLTIEHPKIVLHQRYMHV